MSSPTTSESVRTNSILYNRLLDPRIAESFYFNSLPHWNALLQQDQSLLNPSNLLSRGPLQLLGNNFSLFSHSDSKLLPPLQNAKSGKQSKKDRRHEGDAPSGILGHDGRDNTGGIGWEQLHNLARSVPPGFFSSNFDWKSGPNANPYHLAVALDVIWKLFDKTFL